MRIPQRHTAHLNVLVALAALVCQCVCNAEETNTLEQQVRRQDVAAMKAAGSQGRTDLIPSLEAAANMSADPDEPVRIWAKAALAKLGVRKYLDETIAELTTTNSALYRSYRKSDAYYGSPRQQADRDAEYETQQRALEKLAYIKDRSTVKVIVPFLYAKENPEDYIHRGGFDMVVYQLPSELAMNALAKIVDSPPKIDLPDTGETHDARVKVWQQWWEQNKNKYP